MTSGHSGGSVPAIPRARGSMVARVWRRTAHLFEAALLVRSERQHLAALDDRLLKDIGLSRSLADREASREFFDVPEHRIRLR